MVQVLYHCGAVVHVYHCGDVVHLCHCGAMVHVYHCGAMVHVYHCGPIVHIYHFLCNHVTKCVVRDSNKPTHFLYQARYIYLYRDICHT